MLTNEDKPWASLYSEVYGIKQRILNVEASYISVFDAAFDGKPLATEVPPPT